MRSVPLISVLLAVYRPDYRYLRELLESLAAQDDPRFELLLRDDSADGGATAGRVAQMLEALGMSARLAVNDENIGSRATFERLTRDASGELLAYCDQDDIWEPGKLSALRAAMAEGAALAYCDQAVIDGQGVTLAHSLKAYMPRMEHRSGEGLLGRLLDHNTVTGCAMMIGSETARRALPFPACFVHDYWLALCAAREGALRYVDRPLVRRRLHGGNQVGFSPLSGVENREDYVCRYLAKRCEQAGVCAERFAGDAEARGVALNRRETLAKRISFVRGPSVGGLRGLAREKIPLHLLAFDAVAALCPPWALRAAVGGIQARKRGRP